MDAIYTPPDLAEFVTTAVSQRAPRSIADFAAGDGALLRAAAARWPDASLFGSDIDVQAVEAINSLVPGCFSLQHDFLTESGDDALTGRSFDLILLNPPFSSRGSARHAVDVNGVTYRASKALAFAARALRFLAPGGEVVAILPASVVVSERDAELRAALEDWGSVEQIGDIRRAAFKSHAVAIVVLRISRDRVVQCTREKPVLVSLRPFSVELSRGSVSMHRYNSPATGPRFIHTTDMRQGTILSSERRASTELRRVRGPAVLMSRVGRPAKGKIVLLPEGEAVLSDCVIAMHTSPSGREAELVELLAANWDVVKSAYGGSCAPYTTLKRLAAALLRLGISSRIAKAGGAIVSGQELKPHWDADAEVRGNLRIGA